MTIATAPRIESPTPYPSALYIVGANSGKPKPAHERRNVTAASAATKAMPVSVLAVPQRLWHRRRYSHGSHTDLMRHGE